MGADLILAVSPLPVWEDGTDCANDDDFKAALQQRLATDSSWRDEVQNQNPDVEDNAEEMTWCLDAVQDFMEANDNVHQRDLVTRKFADRWYAFTGGMTWGDDPSDLFAPMLFLDNTGLFIEPFKKP